MMGIQEETAARMPMTNPAMAVPDVGRPVLSSLMSFPFPRPEAQSTFDASIIGKGLSKFISSELIAARTPMPPVTVCCTEQPPKRGTDGTETHRAGA